MKVLWQYTRRNLAKNKVRTFVTILGIILSVSLFTAVSEGLISARRYGIEIVKKTVGSYESLIYSPDSKVMEAIADDNRITCYSILNNIGYADNIGSTNESKPYLKVCEVPDNFQELVAVQLVSGRMPENDKEIILPEHLYSNGGVEHSIGDSLKLNLGERIIDGDILYESSPYLEGEKVDVSQTREYRVVGFYERFEYAIEDYMCPGYTAITKAGSEYKEKSLNPNSIVFVTVNDIEKLDKILGDIGQKSESPTFSTSTNSRLLMLYGYSKDNGLMVVMIGLVVILFALIMVGSVMLIYNSFSISVSERIKQFGLLKSIGATRRQIMMTVMLEAVSLCIVAIPAGLVVGCLGIGITLKLLRGTFDAILNYGDIGVYIGIHVEPAMLIFVAILGIVAVIISAMIPALKVVRIQPIDAVKQSGDVKLRRKDVRTLGIAGKVFGFEGKIASKNYRRSRRKYRTTVISLFVSIVLIISASSFTHYLTHAADVVALEDNYDVMYRVDESGDYTELYNKFKSIEGVQYSNFMLESSSRIKIDKNAASDYYASLLKTSGYEIDPESEEYQGLSLEDLKNECHMRYMSYDATLNPYVELYFVADEDYDGLIRENGIKINDTGVPQALLYDDIYSRVIEDDESRWDDCSMFQHDEFPMKLTAEQYKEVDGYYYNYMQAEFDDNMEFAGEKYIYSPEEGDGTDKILSKDEAIEYHDLYVAGLIKERPMGVDNVTCLIYRISDIDKIFGARKINASTGMYFKAADHNYVTQEIAAIASDYINEHEGRGDGYLSDVKGGTESERALVTIVKVFSYGFIILISLIAVANVFNTISTNILLRRREFAMLKSVGMSDRGTTKMMSSECLLYGFKGLLYGIPASVLVTYCIFDSLKNTISTSFYIPVASIVIAVGSVFAVVFITMVYSMNRIKKDNILDTLRKESI